jgi:hypothetical protein
MFIHFLASSVIEILLNSNALVEYSSDNESNCGGKKYSFGNEKIEVDIVELQ